jgi:hypothetical protein
MHLTLIPLPIYEHAKSRMLVAKERLVCHPMMLIGTRDPIRVALVGVGVGVCFFNTHEAKLNKRM